MNSAAIFLSGRIKGWEQCIQHFELIFKNYNFDIYCSLNCNEEDSDYLEFSKHPKVKNIICSITEKEIDLSLYKNKMETYPHMISMFYHNLKAFSLIEKEYDYYIKARIDLLSHNSIPLIEDINKIHVPSFLCSKNPVRQINDQIAISNYNNMKIYSSLYNHLEEYIFKDNIEFHAETILAHHLFKNNIDVKEFDFIYEMSSYRRDDVYFMERILQHMVYELK